MVKLSTWLVILLYLICLEPRCSFCVLAWPPPAKIHMSDIGEIVLVEGANTTSNRGAPLKQVQCFGSYCHLARVTKVVCHNTGFDGSSIQWACDWKMIASNPQFKCKVGRSEVNCEGYDGPNDVYILNGSCSYRYTVDGPSCTSYGGSLGGPEDSRYALNLVLVFFLVLLAIIFVAVIVAIFMSSSTMRFNYGTPRFNYSAPRFNRSSHGHHYGHSYTNSYTNSYCSTSMPSGFTQGGGNCSSRNSRGSRSGGGSGGNGVSTGTSFSGTTLR